MQRKENRGRRSTFFLLIGMLCFCATACNQIGVQEGTLTPTPTPTAALETEWEGEPCLSKAAQEKLQFAPPVPGETVAELVVEGFGSVYVKLFPDKAPKAVQNFLTHAREGYYDNTLFFRVVNRFMVQGGDPEGTGYGGESIYGAPFEDEIDAQLEPFRGALCMANAGPDTNGSQFFLVQANAASVAQLKELVEYQGYTLSEYLDAGYRAKVSEEALKEYLLYGGAPWLHAHHTVFGQIYDGFSVLDDIASALTNEKYKPFDDIVIETIRVFTY